MSVIPKTKSIRQNYWRKSKKKKNGNTVENPSGFEFHIDERVMRGYNLYI